MLIIILYKCRNIYVKFRIGRWLFYEIVFYVVFFYLGEDYFVCCIIV